MLQLFFLNRKELASHGRPLCCKHCREGEVIRACLGDDVNRLRTCFEVRGLITLSRRTCETKEEVYLRALAFALSFLFIHVVTKLRLCE